MKSVYNKREKFSSQLFHSHHAYQGLYSGPYIFRPELGISLGIGVIGGLMFSLVFGIVRRIYSPVKIMVAKKNTLQTKF